MTKQERDELEQLESLFTHPGWKIFEEEIKSKLSNHVISASIECATNDEWQFRRGVIDTFTWLSGYRDTVIRTLEVADASV